MKKHTWVLTVNVQVEVRGDGTTREDAGHLLLDRIFSGSAFLSPVVRMDGAAITHPQQEKK